MGNFKETLLGLVNNGASQVDKLFKTMDETMNSIDWDAQFKSLNNMKESFLKKSNELWGDFNELMKQVKDNLTDFEVIVPFDPSIGENFKSEVVNDKLVVEVTFKNENTERVNKTMVTIPENCDVDKKTEKYDEVKKVMIVTIPKIVVETPTPNKEEEVETPKKRSTRIRVTTPKKKVATPKETPSEEAHDVSSKLLKKFRENVNLQRDANGRFMRRKNS